MAAVQGFRLAPFFLARPVLLASRLGDVNTCVLGIPGMSGPVPAHALQAAGLRPPFLAGACLEG